MPELSCDAVYICVQELTPGGPQKVWVQSQTTFAQLAKDEEGKYQVRTLKQKIWVEGISYELQEIYGMEQATAAAKDREVSCLITHLLVPTSWGSWSANQRMPRYLRTCQCCRCCASNGPACCVKLE